MLKNFAFGGLLAIGLAFPAQAEEASIPSNFNVNTYLSANTSPAPYSPEAPGDEGKLRFDCEWSHLAFDDPLLNPGVPGGAHLHMFFGNTAANYSSTYSTLRTTGKGTCDGGPINRTAYWFPAMINSATGKVRKPDGIELYYTVNRDDLDDATPGICPNVLWACPWLGVKKMPRGLGFISGFNLALGSNPDHDSGGAPSIFWQCEDLSVGNKRMFWNRTTPSLGVQGCPSSSRLMARLSMGACWDGTTLLSADGRHVKMQKQTGSGLACPAGYPQRLLTIVIIIFWSHDGDTDYRNWYLSSDRFQGADYEPGETLHGDWFGAWDDDIMLVWNTEVNGIPDSTGTMRNTSGGNIGDDRIMNSTGIGPNDDMTISYDAEIGAAREIDMPTLSARIGKWRLR